MTVDREWENGKGPMKHGQKKALGEGVEKNTWDMNPEGRILRVEEYK